MSQAGIANFTDSGGGSSLTILDGSLNPVVPQNGSVIISGSSSGIYGTSNINTVASGNLLGIYVTQLAPFVPKLNAVVPASFSLYDVAVSDVMIACITEDSTPLSIVLPAQGTTGLMQGQVFIIKDIAGHAASGNITVSTADNLNIDGSTSYVINQNFGYVWVYNFQNVSSPTYWGIIGQS
jgi:hypothetical protein